MPNEIQKKSRQDWMDKPTTVRQLRALRNNLVCPVCPVCGREAQKVIRVFDRRATTGHACCGLRSWNYKPLRDDATLIARMQAHAAFDPIWQGGHMGRNEAYSWLARQLGIARAQCHMSLMEREQAEFVVAAVRARQEETRQSLRSDGAVARHRAKAETYRLFLLNKEATDAQ